MQDFWWRDAIIYGVDVGRFRDSNGDGIGDFPGLTEKVPYIAGLGFTCIWLLPFYPSGGRDNGYDVTDYFRVDTRFGQFADFLAFVRVCSEHGIRVVIDLVAHHAAAEHPWFQSARHDRNSPFFNYYIWSDHPPPSAPGKANMFPGEESSVWNFDEVAQSFYYHRFYSFQPGLNHRNPAVIEEIQRIMDFWMSFGISGFRIDAASHMIEDPLDPQAGGDPSHNVLRQLYRHAIERSPQAVMLGEVDEDETALKRFFDGEQMNMMFNFFLDNFMMLALATQDATPLHEAIARLPSPPINGQWANFLRNLDEADLERLAPDDLQRVLDRFAPDEAMRIFGRGIRRRLAPMLADPARLKMAYSLLFAMPGAPLVCYGDEIGMGDDLTAKGRNAVRAPMQWTGGRNGGFSAAGKSALVQPMVAQGPFAYRHVNVARQQEDPGSLLHLIRQLAAIRRQNPAIGKNDCQRLEANSDAVHAVRYQGRGRDLVVLHNLGAKPVSLQVAHKLAVTAPPQLLLGAPARPAGPDSLATELGPYGFSWLLWER